MKFETIKRKAIQAYNKVSGFMCVLDASGGSHIDSKYSESFLDKLSEHFKITPRAALQSVWHVGLFDPDLNKGKDKKKIFRDTIWRLCANEDQLRLDAAVLPCREILFTEEVESKILDVHMGSNNRMYIIQALVLTGHYAPGKIEFKLSYDGLQILLSCIGYDYKKYPPPLMITAALNTFVKLRIKPKEGNSRVVDAILKDDSIRAYNRKNILKFRCGLEPCKRRNNWVCSSCPTPTDCPASYVSEDNDLLF